MLKYSQLKDLFLQLFNVDHLALDLLNKLEDIDTTAAENFILNKMYNNLSTDELIKTLGQDYIKYYAI